MWVVWQIWTAAKRSNQQREYFFPNIKPQSLEEKAETERIKKGEYETVNAHTEKRGKAQLRDIKFQCAYSKLKR